jgi:hypothetical protein
MCSSTMAFSILMQNLVKFLSPFFGHRIEHHALPCHERARFGPRDEQCHRKIHGDPKASRGHGGQLRR